jgi:Tol biopolymer transport system component
VPSARRDCRIQPFRRNVVASPSSSGAPALDTIARLNASLADRYSIERELGAGGMATVYLAHDLKHDRDVALKVLRPDLAAALGGERFLSEIKTTARLQHPHILPLLDSGEADGLLYYVMPFVPGETLRARLDRERQLPIDDALRIAEEVADALGAAHAVGIIHRDIKPENILLQGGHQGGHALVTDFGIALAVQSAGGARMTQTGLSLGTPQYMSPEQAMGERTIDARSDIYALGAVTYEMLTGDPPFTGSSVQAIVAKVTSAEPERLSLTRKTVPPAAEQAVLIALAKLPADRFATTREFAGALRGSGAGLKRSVSAGPSAAAKSAGRRITVPVAAALLLAVGASAWWLGRRTAPAGAALSTFTQLTDASGVETSPSPSPDGESFAYASNARGTWGVYVQRIGGRNPVLVAGDSLSDSVWPAYSPDGKQIAFAKRGDGIWAMGATGENAHRITSFGSMPSWSPDGKQLVFGAEEVFSPYNVNVLGQLYTVSVSGGPPKRLNMNGDAHGYQPAWSPSGSRIAFFTVRSGQRDIETVSAAGGTPVNVTHDVALDWAPSWSADGRYLYFASDRGGAMGIWRVAIDESSGAPRGAPEAIATGADAWFDLPQVSHDGRTIVFRSKIESVNPAAVSFDRAGLRLSNARLLQHRTGSLLPTDASPDGKWLALMSALDRDPDLWVMRVDGSELRRLTDDPPLDWWPRFTPDGKSLTFWSNRSGHYEGYQIGFDGGGLTRLTNLKSDVYYASFAPDGRRLLMFGEGVGAVVGEAPWPLVDARTTSLGPKTVNGRSAKLLTWSPDGRWVAGYLDLPGETRGHVVVEVATGKARQLNDDSDGYAIAWLPDSRHVLYFTRGGTVVMQDISTMARDSIRGTLPFPPDLLGSLVISPDGRTLYYGARQVEANIWMMRRDPVATRP